MHGPEGLSEREYELMELDPFALLVAKQRVDGLYAALAKLPDRDADVVRRRAGLGRAPQTLKQVGDDLGLTPERVRQIQLRAHARLKAILVKAPPPPKRRPGPAPRYLHPKRPRGSQPLGLHHYYPDGLAGYAREHKRRELLTRVIRELAGGTFTIKRYVTALLRAAHRAGLATLDADDLVRAFRERENDLPREALATAVAELVATGTVASDLDIPGGTTHTRLHLWFGAADFRYPRWRAYRSRSGA